MSELLKNNVPNEVKVYTSLQALEAAEPVLSGKIVRKVLMSNLFKSNIDVCNFVNQFMVADLVELAFNPHVVNVIGGMPWTLFHWGYCAVLPVKEVQNEN